MSYIQLGAATWAARLRTRLDEGGSISLKTPQRGVRESNVTYQKRLEAQRQQQEMERLAALVRAGNVERKAQTSAILSMRPPATPTATQAQKIEAPAPAPAQKPIVAPAPAPTPSPIPAPSIRPAPAPIPAVLPTNSVPAHPTSYPSLPPQAARKGVSKTALGVGAGVAALAAALFLT